jgi:hypothetical protein
MTLLDLGVKVAKILLAKVILAYFNHNTKREISANAL